MEISNAVLVAIMFVVILSLGIGNLLMGLSVVIDRRSGCVIDRIHLGWVVLLLVIYLNFFWHTVEIMVLDEWSFGGFLYIVAGPILLFFSGAILTPRPPESDAAVDPFVHFQELSRPFFLLLAAVQAWVIGTDLLLVGHLTAASIFNALAAALALTLASTKREGAHAAGLIAGWLLFILASAIVAFLL